MEGISVNTTSQPSRESYAEQEALHTGFRVLTPYIPGSCLDRHSTFG